MARTIIYVWPDEDARELGRHHGHEAANYADAVSGEDLDLLSPEPTRPLGMTPRAAMFYDDGFEPAASISSRSMTRCWTGTTTNGPHTTRHWPARPRHDHGTRRTGRFFRPVGASRTVTLPETSPILTHDQEIDMSGARTRRIQRIAASSELGNLVRKLGLQADAYNRTWWARHDSREDQTIWLATPISHNGRREDAREDSNYDVAERSLNEASSFGERGQWPDWTAQDGTVYPGTVYWSGGTDTRIDAWPGGTIETLLVRADDAPALRELGKIISALADYPVLDDEHCSALEWDYAHPSDHECYSEDEDCPCAVRNHDHIGPDFRPEDADEDGEIYCRSCSEYVMPGYPRRRRQHARRAGRHGRMTVITTAWHQIMADVAAAWDYSFVHWWILVIAAVLVIAMIVADLTNHPQDGRSSDRSETGTRSGDSNDRPNE